MKLWLEENTYEEVAISAWEEGLLLDLEFPILQCMEHCRTKLDIWNKNVFGHVGNNIARLHKNLEWLEMQVATPQNIASMRETPVELNCWLDKEDLMWKQWSGLNWYREGDRNIGYFNSKASNRLQKIMLKVCWIRMVVGKMKKKRLTKLYLIIFLTCSSLHAPRIFQNY